MEIERGLKQQEMGLIQQGSWDFAARKELSSFLNHV